MMASATFFEQRPIAQVDFVVENQRVDASVQGFEVA